MAALAGGGGEGETLGRLYLLHTLKELLKLPSNFDKHAVSEDNEGPMDVTLAILADAANVSQEGKLNILGEFSNINSHNFPVRHSEMQLVLRFEASPAEAGMKKNIEIRVMDEDGQQVSGFGGELIVPPAKSGRRIRMQTIMRIVDAVFPKEGNYMFSVLVDGKTEAEVPLSLTLLTKGEGKSGD